MAKKYITLNCCECRNEFTKTCRRHNQGLKTNKTGKFYCSNTCSNRANNSSFQIIPCKACGTSNKKSTSQIKKNKTGNFFCNRSCAATHNNKGVVRNPRKIRTCTRCPNTFTVSDTPGTRTILCSDCKEQYILSMEHKNKTIGEYRNMLSVKGKHVSWAHAHIRSFNRSWNKILTKLPCQNCLYCKHIELAHIKPITSYEDHITLSEVNDPENILALCPNCHWEFDNGYLKLEDIPKRITPTL